MQCTWLELPEKGFTGIYQLHQRFLSQYCNWSSLSEAFKSISKAQYVDNDREVPEVPSKFPRPVLSGILKSTSAYYIQVSEPLLWGQEQIGKSFKWEARHEKDDARPACEALKSLPCKGSVEDPKLEPYPRLNGNVSSSIESAKTFAFYQVILKRSIQSTAKNLPHL